MRYSQGHNFPIFDNTDVADLNDYSDKLAQKLETATGNQDERIDEQLRNMTLEDPSSAEIVDARGGYDLLRYRFEADEANITNNTTKVNKKVYYHANVASMKADNSLSAGDVVQTLGYYAADDGGQGLYQIITSTAADDGGSIHVLNNGLRAKLIVDNWVNVKQMGAKGDGTTDDTAKIQLAFNKYHNIFISDGTYMIDAVTSLKPHSQTHIKLAKAATLKAITNSNTNYSIIKIFNNRNNILIEGGTIQGDRDTHTSEEGEWGHGISVYDSQNIYLENIILKDCWGDGFYLGSGTNINTENLICDNNRRQGISIISVNGYHSLNDRLINTNGTAPQAGMDIEPNYDTEILKNIVIENLYTSNNSGYGLQMYLMKIVDNSNKIDITILNHTDKKSNRGFMIAKSPTSNGCVKLVDCTYIEPNESGIYCDRCYDSDLRVEFIRPKVINANFLEVVGTSGRVAFEISESKSSIYSSTYALGNVHVIEPYFSQTINEDIEQNVNIPCIYCRNTANTNTGLNNVTILNPTYLSNSNVWMDKYLQNSLFKDDYKVTKIDVDADINLRSSRFHSYVSNNSHTQNRVVNIINDLLIGSEITFVGRLNSHPLKIIMPDGSYALGLGSSQVQNAEITLSKGAIVKMTRLDNAYYYFSANNQNLVTATSSN